MKRETLQSTKYVELLLVADYAEVRKGMLFIPTGRWAQSKHPGVGRAAGDQQVSSCHPDGPTLPAGRESSVLVTFVLAAIGCDLVEGLGLGSVLASQGTSG